MAGESAVMEKPDVGEVASGLGDLGGGKDMFSDLGQSAAADPHGTMSAVLDIPELPPDPLPSLEISPPPPPVESAAIQPDVNSGHTPEQIALMAEADRARVDGTPLSDAAANKAALEKTGMDLSAQMRDAAAAGVNGSRLETPQPARQVEVPPPPGAVGPDGQPLVQPESATLSQPDMDAQMHDPNNPRVEVVPPSQPKQFEGTSVQPPPQIDRFEPGPDDIIDAPPKAETPPPPPKEPVIIDGQAREVKSDSSSDDTQSGREKSGRFQRWFGRSKDDGSADSSQAPAEATAADAGDGTGQPPERPVDDRPEGADDDQPEDPTAAMRDAGEAQPATPAPLDAEAQGVLQNIDQGGELLRITDDVKRIAENNGIEITDQTTPAQFIEALKSRQGETSPAAAEPAAGTEQTTTERPDLPGGPVEIRPYQDGSGQWFDGKNNPISAGEAQRIEDERQVSQPGGGEPEPGVGGGAGGDGTGNGGPEAPGGAGDEDEGGDDESEDETEDDANDENAEEWSETDEERLERMTNAQMLIEDFDAEVESLSDEQKDKLGEAVINFDQRKELPEDEQLRELVVRGAALHESRLELEELNRNNPDGVQQLQESVTAKKSEIEATKASAETTEDLEPQEETPDDNERIMNEIKAEMKAGNMSRSDELAAREGRIQDQKDFDELDAMDPSKMSREQLIKYNDLKEKLKKDPSQSELTQQQIDAIGVKFLEDFMTGKAFEIDPETGESRLTEGAAESLEKIQKFQIEKSLQKEGGLSPKDAHEQAKAILERTSKGERKKLAIETRVKEKLQKLMALEMQAMGIPRRLENYRNAKDQLKTQIKKKESEIGQLKPGEVATAQKRSELYNMMTRLASVKAEIARAKNIGRQLNAQYTEEMVSIKRDLKLAGRRSSMVAWVNSRMTDAYTNLVMNLDSIHDSE